MKFYIAVNNKPDGPYSIDEITAKNLAPDTLLWREGMKQWTPIKNIPELNTGIVASDNNDEYIQCPRTWLALAIIGIVLFTPLGIVATIKAAFVKRLWEEGKYDEAEEQSKSAKKFAILSLMIGIPLQILGALYYSFYFNQLFNLYL